MDMLTRSPLMVAASLAARTTAVLLLLSLCLGIAALLPWLLLQGVWFLAFAVAVACWLERRS